jgi:hypothetical protein
MREARCVNCKKLAGKGQRISFAAYPHKVDTRIIIQASVADRDGSVGSGVRLEVQENDDAIHPKSALRRALHAPSACAVGGRQPSCRRIRPSRLEHHHSLAPDGTEELVMRTYNLFRRKGQADLVCAIPEDWPVPAFIDATSWDFGGKLEASDAGSSAFNREAADASVRFIGFYLFQVTKALQLGRPVEQAPDKGSFLEAPGCRGAPRRETTQALGRWHPARARGGDRQAERMRVPAGLRCGP